jgi:hypothetical protein
LVLSIPVGSHARDIFVDNTAGGAGDGSSTTPFDTIQEAIDASDQGDVVKVRPGTGTYFEQVEIGVEDSGAAGSFLTVTAEPVSSDFSVVIDGEETRSNGFYLDGASYVHIIGFKVIRTRGVGIYARGPNIRSIHIASNFVRETGSSSISVWGTRYGVDPAGTCSWLCAEDIHVYDNIVERAANTYWGAGGFNEHITIANGVRDVWVHGNTIQYSMNSYPDYQHGAGGEGIDLKEGVENGFVYGNLIFEINKYGIYLDAGRSATDTGGYTEPAFLRNIHVFNNVVHSSGNHGIGIVSEGRIADSATGADGRKGGWVRDVYIYNNTVFNNVSCGMLVYDYGLLDDGFTLSNVPIFDNVHIYNNIFHDNNTGGNSGYSGIRVKHDWGTNIVIRNNVTNGNNTGIVIASGSQATVSANLRDVDPDFVSESTPNLELSDANSPAVDAADTTYVPDSDFEGTSRPRGAGYDIGAYEYDSGVDTTAPAPPGGLRID